jgi:hypothetical protein
LRRRGGERVERDAFAAPRLIEAFSGALKRARDAVWDFLDRHGAMIFIRHESAAYRWSWRANPPASVDAPRLAAYGSCRANAATQAT